MSARPRLHLTAPHNWLSDPNGPIEVDGEFHLFYQHNPQASEWGLMHWGHASSTDLLRWTHHPIALTPDPDGPDADGCWSGCIRTIDDRHTAFYTGASGTGSEHRQVVLCASAESGLSALRREPHAVVVPAADPKENTHQHRDPFLLQYEDTWLMLLGTGIATGPGAGQGAVVVWESADTVHWTRRGMVLTLPRDAAPVDLGPVWECPQLFRIGDDWVLIVSVQLPGTPHPECPYAVWFIGDFDGTSFEPRESGVLDSGRVFYAPALTAQTADRHVLWGWIQEDPTVPASSCADFAGLMSLPREVTVEDGRVVTRPAREVEAAWGTPVAQLKDVTLGAGESAALSAAVGDTYRVRVTGSAPLLVTLANNAVTLGVGHGDLSPELASRATAWVRLDGREKTFTLEVLVDASVIEAFADGAAPLTLRVQPGSDAGAEVRVLTPAGGVIELLAVDALAI